MINALFFISLILTFIPIFLDSQKFSQRSIDKWFFSKNIFIFLPTIIILFFLSAHDNLKIVLTFNCLFSFILFFKKIKSYKLLVSFVHLLIGSLFLKYLWPSDISRSSLAALNIIISSFCVLFLDIILNFIKKNALVYCSYFLLFILIVYNGFMFFELAF